MTWITLRDALEMAAACGFDVDGETGVAAPVVSQKKDRVVATPAVVGSNQPSSPKRPVLRNIKRGRTHDLSSEPPLGVRPRLLLVWDSGRSPAGRNNEAPAFRRNSRGDGLRETKLRLVSG